MKWSSDLFGIGWRPQLAAGVLSNLDRIDIVEVMADDFFDAPRRERRALRTLAAQITVTLHGVSLGLGSSAAVETRRLDEMARLVEEVEPAFWSEHLAFVRAGGVEIGHLAAPPRTDATADGAAANALRAARLTGSAPLLENVATLIEPPGSCYDEATWISRILTGSGCPILLDLHNLYANSVNFGFDPSGFIEQVGIERIGAVHLAGGKWVRAGGVRRLLDDHLHDVPDPVYDLLREVGARGPGPLTVIIERDGDYPSMESLLEQLDRARDALAEGRARAVVEEKGVSAA